MLLYLVRHGETDWNLAHRIQGNTDVPLNRTGRAQARAAGRLLAGREWIAIVASSLSRARDTASIIAAELGLPEPTTLDALMERNYGSAEGLSYSEIDARFPGDTPVPGRETREEVVERVLPALLHLAERHRDQSVIVVTHGGVIRSLLNVIDPHGRHPKITNGSIHSFRHEDGAFALIAFDDPIIDESLEAATDDLEDQNAVEAREAAGLA